MQVKSHNEEILWSGNFQEGIDYEVVSMSLIDDEGNEFSLDELIGKSSQEFFEQYNIEKDFYENTVLTLGSEYSELFPTMINGINLFYLTEREVHFDNAMTFGLGVVRFLKGEHKGKYMLYNATPYEDNTMTEEELIKINAQDELIMLAMYYQYTFPNDFDNKKLEALLNNNEEYVYPLITKNHQKVLSRFKEIFDSKKGGSNIVQFPIRSEDDEKTNR